LRYAMMSLRVLRRWSEVLKGTLFMSALLFKPQTHCVGDHFAE